MPGEQSWPYYQGLRGVPGVWRGVVAIVTLLGVGYLGYVGPLIPLSSAIDVARGAGPLDPTHPALTTGLVLANSVLLTALIPVSALLQWAVFGVRPRWMLSVVGGFRWRWFVTLAAVVVPVWAVVVLVLQLLEPFGPFTFSAGNFGLLALVLVSTPLQSAGEEFAFRGLVQRATGAWFQGSTRAWVVSTAITSAVFAAVHLSSDPWAVAYYLTAGVGLSAVTAATGGLEASVLLHATGNTLVLVPAVLAGRTDSLAVRSKGPALLVPSLGIVISTGLVRWLARQESVTTTAAPPPTRRRLEPSTRTGHGAFEV